MPLTPRQSVYVQTGQRSGTTGSSGLQYRWKNCPLSLSCTRGRPVPAEMLPARSPQPLQQRTGRVAFVAGSGIVVVVLWAPPFGLEALEWFGDWLRGRFLIYTRRISQLIAFVNGF
jgi:hypothetical protein